MNDNISISVPIQSDDKGYLDRECPNEKCLFIFKVNVEDWRKNFLDEKLFIVRCVDFQRHQISGILMNSLKR